MKQAMNAAKISLTVCADAGCVAIRLHSDMHTILLKNQNAVDAWIVSSN